MRAYRKVDEGYELKIEGGRLILLGVGALLTLMLVFLVGVLVGKGLWSEPPRPEVAASGVVQGTPVPPREEASPQYTFFDELKKPDAGDAPAATPSVEGREVAAETPISVAPVASGAVERASTPPVPTKPEAKASEAVAAENVIKKPEPLAKAQAPLPAPQFTIQIGSFRDRASAERQAAQTGAQGVSAQVVQISMEGRTWFRVQVGRFQTRADAENHYQKRLRAKGVQGFVTTR